MPQFYFNLRDEKHLADDKGTDFPNVEAAQRAAVEATGEALRDAAKDFWNAPQMEMQVTDVTGASVCTVTVTAHR